MTLKTEEELFAALEALDQAERDLRSMRLELDAQCRSYGAMEGIKGFRIDHLRVRHNVKMLRKRAMEEV